MRCNIDFRVLLLLICCGISCRTPGLYTVWKDQDAVLPLARNSQLLVIGILKDSSLVLRQDLEGAVAAGLNNLGYRAVSALQEYGRDGLFQKTNEESYRVFRAAGMDAIVTVALINAGKDKRVVPKGKNNLAAYYYNRIATYGNILEDLTALETEATATAYWETIVFDLRTLTPTLVIRSGSYYTLSAIDLYKQVPALLIEKLQKEKLITGVPVSALIE